MAQRRGMSSISHPHTLMHKLASTRVWHVRNGATLEALIHRGMTPKQARDMRWGMNVHIDNVMYKVERNLRQWNEIVLAAKEFNLSLDENQFEHAGGEITWHRYHPDDWYTDLGMEEEADGHIQKEEAAKEEVKVKSPMKVFVGVENIDEVECTTKTLEGPMTDADIQAFGNCPIEDFKKYFSLDDWTGEAVKSFQTWLRASKEERGAATRNVLNAASAADPERTAALIKSLVESPAETLRRSAVAQASTIPSTTDNSHESFIENQPAYGVQDSLLNTPTALEHDEVQELLAGLEARTQQFADEYGATPTQVVRQPERSPSQRRAKVFVTAGGVVTIQSDDNEPLSKADAEAAMEAFGKEHLASQGMSDPVIQGNAAEKLAAYREEAIAKGVVTYQGVCGLAAKGAGTRQSHGTMRSVPYERVPQMDFQSQATQATQERIIAKPKGAFRKGVASLGDEPAPQWVLREVDDSGNPVNAPPTNPLPGCLKRIDPFEGIYPPEKVRGTEPYRYTPRTAKTDAEELAEIEEDTEAYKKAMVDRKQELMSDAEIHAGSNLLKGISSVARDQLKKEGVRLDIEIKIRTDQYKAMLIAGRNWEKGETGPPGLGEEAQKSLSFLSCDPAEQIRRAGHSFLIRDAYYTRIKDTGPNTIPPPFTAEEVRAFTGMWGSEHDDADPEYEAYEAELAAEYEACLATGMSVSGAAKKATKTLGKKQVPVTDGIEDQIRRRQEAREKQERERAKMIRERGLAKEAAAEAAKGKKVQKGKGGGRKHKK